MIKIRTLISYLLSSIFVAPLFADKITTRLMDEIHYATINGKPKVKVWIYFDKKDINNNNYYKLNDAYQRKRLNKNGIYSPRYEDIPIVRNYLDILDKYKIEIKTVSKWLNAVSAYVTTEQLYMLESLPFIAKIDVVHSYKRKLVPSESESFRNSLSYELDRTGIKYNLDYGKSKRQLEMLNIPLVHDLGFSGKGVRICLLDGGFNTDHESFKNLSIFAEWDFINNDGIVKDQPGDPYASHNHGTSTLSLIGAFKEGMLIGGAFKADFILGKTEDIASETPIEEDYWVAGIEWADSLGAEIISSSLGYMNFDDGSGYNPDDMDGMTAVTSKIASTAAKRGIILVTSVGNEGPYNRSITTPADAKDIISVGAVDFQGIIADFSSRGPTADDRIKPEVIALGLSCYIAEGSAVNFYGSGSGTSFSAPLIASAAAIILEAHPDWTPLKIMEALKITASRAQYPDNDYGWGIINVFSALNYNIPALTSDFDENGRTDGDDLAIISASFGSTSGDTYWNQKADLDNNGVIDGEDLVLFSISFNKSDSNIQ